MGYVFTEVILRNSRDASNALRGIIKESDIHQKTVEALVDTGCFSIVINEELCKELGLRILGEKEVDFADKSIVLCKEAEPVEIHWKDRSTTLRPTVMPGTMQILLGAFPLEAMDLIVDPRREEVTRAHGDHWVCYV